MNTIFAFGDDDVKIQDQTQINLLETNSNRGSKQINFFQTPDYDSGYPISESIDFGINNVRKLC